MGSKIASSNAILKLKMVLLTPSKHSSAAFALDIVMLSTRLKHKTLINFLRIFPFGFGLNMIMIKYDNFRQTSLRLKLYL